MAKLAKLYGLSGSPVSISPSDQFVSTRRIGVELEYENLANHPSEILDEDLWEVTEDGSLRNISPETFSLEIRYQQPLGGLDSSRALLSLKKLLARDKGIICSERTGLHVHVDFRDATLYQLRNFIICYLMAEPFLYEYCGEGRENNIFCIPLYKSPHLLSGVLSMGGYLRDSQTRGLGMLYKYSGLNIGSLSRKGSVEFRMHKSSKNINAIYTWINILLSLVEHGLRSNINLKKFLHYLDAGGDFIGDTFGEYGDVLRTANMERNLEIGKESIYTFMCSQTTALPLNALVVSESTKVTPSTSAEEEYEIVTSTPTSSEVTTTIETSRSNFLLDSAIGMSFNTRIRETNTRRISGDGRVGNEITGLDTDSESP
jgi:hypothetical protein